VQVVDRSLLLSLLRNKILNSEQSVGPTRQQHFCRREPSVCVTMVARRLGMRSNRLALHNISTVLYYDFAKQSPLMGFRPVPQPGVVGDDTRFIFCVLQARSTDLPPTTSECRRYNVPVLSFTSYVTVSTVYQQNKVNNYSYWIDG
jgi:hypothetical protein